MSVKFAWLVELLQDLDKVRTNKALPTGNIPNHDHDVVTRWFGKYNQRIPRSGGAGVAFLSCLFPERCPQRSYNLQVKRLSFIFGRALGLGRTRAARLNAWLQEDGDDFASCIEVVMSECEFDAPEAEHEVTLEEIDAVLFQIAANSPFSSPEIRRHANGARTDDLLSSILRRLQSFEAKWLVRMLLKNYLPIQIPEQLALQQYHFLLPDILQVQNSIEAAVETLSKAEFCGLPPNPPEGISDALKTLASKALVPKLGVMIKRQPYDKARSIKHCCDTVGERIMSVERKYDGEYCQIHISISQGEECIQIFSKSGKDSTRDRFKLTDALKSGLRLGTQKCKISQKCILEGELLVWNRAKSVIEPFYKLRRHCMHGGRYLGIEKDSPVSANEQLMVMLYDILLLDDKALLHESHNTRRKQLKGIVNVVPGVIDIGERRVVDFKAKNAAKQLCIIFGKSIVQGWEGLILKGCQDPYFSIGNRVTGIKLKKDYISGCGDTVDLCIIGGRRDAVVEEELGHGKLAWTTFYIACIENRDAVERFNTKPIFRVVDSIGRHALPKDVIFDLNRAGQFLQIPFVLSGEHMEVKIENPTVKQPTTLFKEPFVVEIYGAGFDKLAGCSFFTLRFPRSRSVKLHTDRTIVDTMTFGELQSVANLSILSFRDPRMIEEAKWIKRLLGRESSRRNPPWQSQSVTPNTASNDMGSKYLGEYTSPSSCPVTGSEKMLSGERHAFQQQSPWSKTRRATNPSITERKRKLSATTSTSRPVRKRHRYDDSPLEIKSARHKHKQQTRSGKSPITTKNSMRTSSTIRNQNVFVKSKAKAHAAAQYQTLRLFEEIENAVDQDQPPYEANCTEDVSMSKSPTTPMSDKSSFKNRSPLAELSNFSSPLSREVFVSRRSVMPIDQTGIIYPRRLDAANADSNTNCEKVPPACTANTIQTSQIITATLTSSVGMTKQDYTRAPENVSPRHDSQTNGFPTSTNETHNHANSRHSNTVAPPFEMFSTLFPSTILLGSSLHPVSKLTNTFEKAITDNKLSITFSPAQFLEQLPPDQNLFGSNGVILVDISKREVVAKDILETGRAILQTHRTRQKQTTLVTINNQLPVNSCLKLLFFDYHFFLHSLNLGFRKDYDMNILRKYFAGCLHFNPSVLNDRGECSVRVVWNWKEATT